MEKTQLPLAATPALETHHRWMWVRRFIMSLMLIAVTTYYIAPTRLTQLWTSDTTHVVLHTGFPQVDSPDGQPVKSHQAAAIAFSPQAVLGSVSASGEGWWDRMFPWKHVHLASVQLAVASEDLSQVKVRLSVCDSARDSVWQKIPNDQKCVSTATVGVAEVIEGKLGMVEWVPEETIVLRKRNIYWLIVASDSDTSFDWVFAQAGSTQQGLAYETPEQGWVLQQTDEEPIPSVMLTVTDH